MPTQVRGQGLDEQRGAQDGQFIAEGAGVIIWQDGEGALVEHGAGVDARVHAHDGDAGLGVAVEDGGLDGGGAAPARQEGGVDVDTAVFGQIEHGRAQDLTEGGDNDQVGGPGLQLGQGFGLAQARRLDGGQAQFLCQPFDGRRGEGPTAPGRTIGLGDHTDHGVVLYQGLQGRQSKIGRTHEDDFEVHGFISARRAWSFSQSSSLTRVITR